MTRIVGVLAMVLSLGLSGCSSDERISPTGSTTATGPTTVTSGTSTPVPGCVDLTADGPIFTITISGRAFQPDCLTVDDSQKAQIVNQDSVRHSLTIDGTEVDRAFEGGETFTGPGPFGGVIGPGSYDFYCRFHEEMTGTMTVI
jgi:plastocyanin